MKKSKTKTGLNTGGLRGSQGQAIIEYVLILIISVSLVITMMNYMFKPFGEFISQYMGQYTACLLEYGELPTLGGEAPSTVDEEGECTARFEAATIAGGRPPKAGGGNSATTTTRKPKEDGVKSASGGSRSGGGGARAPGRRSAGVESAGGSRPAGKTVEINLDSGPGSRYFGSDNRENVLKRTDKTSYVPITGLSESDRKKIEKEKLGRGRTVASGEGFSPPVKKRLVKNPIEKIILPDDEGLTIGNFIRYLFIAALIILLIVFVGGQALQMSKSGEK